MESGGISRVIDFLAKRPELDQCLQSTSTPFQLLENAYYRKKNNEN